MIFLFSNGEKQINQIMVDARLPITTKKNKELMASIKHNLFICKYYFK